MLVGHWVIRKKAIGKVHDLEIWWQGPGKVCLDCTPTRSIASGRMPGEVFPNP